MIERYFKLIREDKSINDSNTMYYQGLWLPESGYVSALDQTELTHEQMLAGWWVGRIVSNRLATFVDEGEQEVTHPTEAVALLSPLFNALSSRSLSDFRTYGSFSFTHNNRGPLKIAGPLPEEAELAEQLEVDDPSKIYEYENCMLSPQVRRIGEKIVVEPAVELSLLAHLGVRVSF